LCKTWIAAGIESAGILAHLSEKGKQFSLVIWLLVGHEGDKLVEKW
jgi:hypothetical protein